ncbi:MAG: 4-phosphoerythronate dehydrogenase [Tidjanibacter sp.]|nr:4-phosphoerythronate dehydrogenase [Tidjanibacter sp.]MBR3852994.1 4-phosphoerythronate dehydrogenase [Tidjanibacter sp.]
MKIVIDKFVPYLADVLAPYAEVVEVDGREFPKELLGDADGLVVRTRTRCNEALLGGADKLRFVGTATIGYDHIDRPWLASRGIRFTSAAGCNSRAVLQWVAAALAHLSAKQGWTPQERTVGVVGVGHVGRLVADYARSWGFRVLCSDPPREQAEGLGRGEGFVPLEELLSQSDIVTLHTPLTRTGDHPTLHLVNHTTLALMHDGATLFNASRGEVADTTALLDNAHRLTLCIDTWEGEPDNINRNLLQVAEIATPHIAGYSAQGKANASAIVLDALADTLGIGELKGWYPKEVAPSYPRPIGWSEMCAQIGAHCPLAEESNRMKQRPEEFEHRRNTYPLREEFF